jgi:DNA-directed RNA polymerase specialized sigma24 family protein
MGLHDQTDMGGTAATFLTTRWSLIGGIQKQQDPDRALIGLLLERYWKPVYCYIRRRGYANEEAKDLTQGFFHEVVLNRQLIERADPAKGRFRSFLLHAVKQYLTDQMRRESAERMIPKDKLVPLDIADPPALPQTISESTPEDCFLYAWKSAVLDRALTELKAECMGAGLETHWCVFHDRVLGPILEEIAAPSIADVCRRYGIASESAASNMMVTVKRRFQNILKRQLRATVLCDADADEELQDLLKTWPIGAQDAL